MTASNSTAMQGRCLCGAVTLSATAPQAHMVACHCHMCRIWSGGPLLAVPAGDSLRIDGQEHVTRYPSSERTERAFCNRCGTHLFFYRKGDGTYACPAGLFPQADNFDFSGEIFMAAKPAHYAFAGQRPRADRARDMDSFAPPNEPSSNHH